MVDVEQRPVRPLEQHLLPLPDRAVDEQRRVGQVRPQPLRVALVAGRQLLELDRLDAVHAIQPDVLLGQRHLDLLAEDLRVEQVLQPDPEPVGLVGVGGADAAAGRADLELPEPPLTRLVERQVPGHDHVGVAGQPDEVGGDPARLEALELLDEHARVDHAAGADHAFLAPEDPRGHVAELEGLAAGDDRVPGVRAAVVAADEIRVAGEQVDDLPLALVAPLRPDDHGRGHEPSIGPASGRLPGEASRPSFARPEAACR